MKMNTPFPYNIFKEIGIGKGELPKDAEATLYYVLYSECKQKEADILLMRYRDDIALKDIADSYLLSPARIYSLTQEVLQRLKQERIVTLLQKGVRTYIEEERQKSYAFGKGDYQKVFQREPERVYESKYNDSIEKLNLPSRTYNALLDNTVNINGIKSIAKVGDLIAVGSKGLISVKGIGMKAFNLIADILVNEYGEDRNKWRWRRYYD